MSSASPPPSPQTGTSQPRNPVFLRIQKVLGTKFTDDADMRDALDTLSGLYIQPTGTGKGKEVVRVVDEDSEDAEDDIKNSSTKLVEIVPGEIAIKARKHLQRDMERKLAEGSQQILKAFAEVDKKLNELQDDIATMRNDCDEAEKQLSLSNEASKSLLERAGNLRDERQEVESRKSIVSFFLSRFTLNEDESEALVSRDIPVGRKFFDAMEKTDRIRNDCRLLMSGEDGPTQAGLDIMASTSSYLEQGFDKIFRYCSFEFRQMGRDIHVEVPNTMNEAIRRLKARPELLGECLNTLAEVRQSTLLSAFLAALTRGGPSGFPRPIELHAHDPLRYIGDILAWVHQAIAAEHEFLESLFGIRGDGRMVGSVRVLGESEEEAWTRELMDLAVGKLCVPLKARVLQTVRSQESCIISYRISNLLQFYMLTIRRTIGDDALLSRTLIEVTDAAYKSFYDAIEAQGRGLLRVALDPNDTSVSPPAPITEHTFILREIMNVYESSLMEGVSAHEQEEGFRRIGDIMVDPALEMCRVASFEKRRLRGRWDREVFLLNCLAFLEGVLEPFAFTRKKQVMIEGLLEEQVRLLTEEHFENILIDSGLINQHKALKEPNLNNVPLSRLPSLTPSELQTALHKFSLWLSGPEIIQSPRLSHLTKRSLHEEIHLGALGMVKDVYGRLCEEVRRGSNRYEAAQTLLGGERPFGQVHLLGQIFGLREE